MTKNKKKTDPAISKHFSDLAQRSWAVRKAKILAGDKPKVTTKK